MASPMRMCSGCRDFKDHTQHHIASVPAATVIKLLEESGHPPKFVAM